MTSLALAIDPAAITPAWRSFQQTLPVRFAPIRNETEYQNLIQLLNGLIDIVGDDETHDLADFLDLVGQLITDYEHQYHPVRDARPGEVLRFLMEQQGLTICDLSNDIGDSTVVSAILNGQRELDLEQVKALSGRFSVSPAVFMTERNFV